MSGAPALARSPVQLGLVLGFVAGCAGLGLAAAPVILPALADDLELEVGQTAWILSAFSLALAVMTPVFGRLADRRGSRGTLAAGTALGVSGALLVLIAPSFPLIVAGRLLQGAGAAALSIVAFGVAGHHLEAAARARALGVLTAVSSLFLGSGPLIGAGVDAAFGWRATLALPVLAALAVGILARLAPSDAAVGAAPLDLTGAALVLTAGSGVTALLQARTTGLNAATVALIAVVTAAAFVVLRGHARRRPEGFLPRAVVSNPLFVALSCAGGAIMTGYLGMAFLAPLLLTPDGHPRTAVQVGVLLLPAAAAAALAAEAVGRLLPRVAVERILVALAGGATTGMLVAGLGHRTTVAIVVGSAAATSGFAGAQVALLDRVSELVPAEDRGVALGTFNLIFVTGGALGAALAGGLTDLRSPSTATLGIAALPLLAVPMATLVRRQALA